MSTREVIIENILSTAILIVKPPRIRDMIWIWKVFGSVIIFGSGQITTILSIWKSTMTCDHLQKIHIDISLSFKMAYYLRIPMFAFFEEWLAFARFNPQGAVIRVERWIAW